MSSSYLISGLDDLPKELQHGSLFRFPLRHSEELVKASKIMDHENHFLQPLSAKSLETDLDKWIPDMKSFMFFLNNVKEIKFMVIMESNTVSTRYHYTSSIPKLENVQGFITKFQTAVSNFKAKSLCQPDRILYPLTIKDHRGIYSVEEEWLIQLGVGDIRNHGVHWQYIKTVKPKHGIAAPLKVSQDILKKQKQLFCFLPLPNGSGVPVHINGSFILNSTRRDLWTSSTPGEVDNKDQWNLNLFGAIASSYADFLENSKTYYVKDAYQNWKTALDDLRLYCKMYPCNEISTLAAKQKIRDLFKHLATTNASIVCVFLSKTKTNLQHITTEWHPLNSLDKKNQVYFWGITENHKIIHPILETLGMKITSTDNIIRDILNASISDSEKKIPSISPESVFQYYTTYSCCSANNGMNPTHISNTIFNNIETFLLFAKFLLKVPEKNTEGWGAVSSLHRLYTQQKSSISYEGLFPGNPVSHFLLVSADNVLKQFDQSRKLLSSEYSNLFFKDLDKFVHLSLRELQMNKIYFILDLSEEEHKQYATGLVLQVFKNALPAVLADSSVIEGASSVIDKNELFKYWNVLKKDSVIQSYLPHILQHLAILLTTNDKLYSLTSKITPMYLPHGEISEEAQQAIKVLNKLKLPFLDELVVTVKVRCPHLIDDIDQVLHNIVIINKANPLTSILEKNDINILIIFLGKHIINQKVCVDSLKSLPLFENVTGEYQSILHQNTFIWPDSCSNGYSSWIAGHKVIFLKSDAHWKRLGSAQQFSVSQISEIGLYNQFIFPHPYFALMCEKDRYAHLEYIRDLLFYMIQEYRQRTINKRTIDSERQKICEAKTFYDSLVSLQCIGPTNSSLLPISAFCDHTKKIFCVFSDVFKTLPDALKNERWLQFFKSLNIKQLLLEQEYIDLCRKTGNREVNNITEASDVLVEYLRDDGHSYSDYTFGVISNVPFVCSRKPLEVDWIVPGFAQANQLVPMKGSALLCIQHQLWTVRPLITLPRYTEEMIKKLGVISKASDVDIISNITNISKTPYSEEQLFTNYPTELKVPSSGTVCNLINIMCKNLECLSPNSDCSGLQNLPCIPVNTDLNRQDGLQVALVKPHSVIKFAPEVNKFHPYLYTLPEELSHIIIQNTLNIASDITIKHMQIVLEKVFLRCDGKEIIATTEKVVQLALSTLESQLGLISTESSNNQASSALNPLYLPDVNKRLRPSTSLLYEDDFSFGRMELDLKDTPFHHLNFKKLNYDIFTTEFCSLIPESVRPIGMSHQCIKVLDDSCEEVPSSSLASIIQDSITDWFSENLTHAITHYVSERKKKEPILEKISPIFNSLQVKTINNLKAHVKMKSTGKVLGHVKTDYIFDESNNCLYLDSKLRPLREHATGEISKCVIKAVRPLLKSTLKPEIEKKLLSFINDFLKSSPQEKLEMLDNLNIVGTIDTFNFDTLGAEIPRFLHDRLDQDANNIYNPMEIVGYESEEDKIIVAQIVYLVPSEHEQSVFLNKYKIYAGENDEKGIEVSILKLYKFLEGDKKPPVNSTHVRDESESVVLHDGGNQLTQLRASYHPQSAASKRRLICNQLREIWELPENLRRSGIRRLYLHYHPDRNLDNMKEYDSLFQFLQAQILHLEKNELLDDPDDEASLGTSRSRPQDTDTSWFRDFTHWNATASSYRRNRNFHERDNFKPHFQTSFSKSEEDIDRRDPSEGKRWILQAENEMTVLRSCLLQADDTEGYAHVCFLSHEVAEKALKGGLYALCGLDARKIDNHQLSDNAHALRTMRPHEARHLPDHCLPLEDHYLNTRFPNQWPGHTDAPCNHYHIQDAMDAKQHAEKILEIVLSIMP